MRITEWLIVSCGIFLVGSTALGDASCPALPSLQYFTDCSAALAACNSCLSFYTQNLPGGVTNGAVASSCVHVSCPDPNGDCGPGPDLDYVAFSLEGVVGSYYAFATCGGQFDLAVSNLQLTQSNQPATLGADGNLQVQAGAEVQITAPVTFTTNLGTDGTATEVDLLVDSQLVYPLFPELLPNATTNVVFTTAFGPGTHTISVVVNPKDSPKEADHSNNTANAKVDVVGAKYKLKVTLPDTPASDQQSQNPGILAIMPMSNYGGAIRVGPNG